MTQDPEAVVEGVYAAWRLKDVAATLAYCTDDIRYIVHQPKGTKGVGGTMRGKGAVRSYLTAVAARWDNERLEILTAVVDGDEVRCRMGFDALHRPTGLLLSGTKRQVFRTRDGRIAFCEEYQDACGIKAFLAMAEAL